MSTLTDSSGRVYEALPVDVSRGFPQTFAHVLGGRTYVFRLYVNVPAERLAPPRPDVLDLTTEDGALVLEVQREAGDGTRRTVFARRLLPAQTYAFDGVELYVPAEAGDRRNVRVAPGHLHGTGAHATTVTVGARLRWA